MDGKKVALGSLILLMTALVGVCNALNFGTDTEDAYVAPNGDVDPEATSVFYSDDAVGVAADAGAFSDTSIFAPSDIVFDNQESTMYATAPFSMRSGPGIFYLSVSKFYYGQEVHVTGTSDSGWYKIDYNNEELYAYSACLTEAEPPAKTITDEYGVVFDIVDEDSYVTVSHYIMSGPGIDYDNVGTLRLGQRVHLVGTSATGWNLIDVDGEYLYVYGECIAAEANEVRITIDDVGTTMVDTTGYSHATSSIRQEPSSASQKIGSVRYGDKVHVVGICDNGFFEIEENGRIGYVSGAAIQFTEPRRRDTDEEERESIFDEIEEETEEDEQGDNSSEITVVTGNTDGDTPDATPTETPAETQGTDPASVVIVTVDVENNTTGTTIIDSNEGGTDETSVTEEVVVEATPTPTPLPTPTPTPEPTPAPVSTPEGYQNPSEAQRLLQMVNDYRAQNGLGPLSWSSELESAAQVRASEISIPNCFSHTRPDGSDYWTANSNLIYGENIAAGQATAESVFESWINSDAHRGNILGNYTIMGVGLYVTSGAAYTYYWAQEFG